MEEKGKMLRQQVLHHKIIIYFMHFNYILTTYIKPSFNNSSSVGIPVFIKTLAEIGTIQVQVWTKC